TRWRRAGWRRPRWRRSRRWWTRRWGPRWWWTRRRWARGGRRGPSRRAELNHLMSRSVWRGEAQLVPSRHSSRQPSMAALDVFHGGKLMSNLVVLDFDGIHTADEVLNKLRSMQKEYLIDLEDACVVERDKNGK